MATNEQIKKQQKLGSGNGKKNNFVVILSDKQARLHSRRPGCATKRKPQLILSNASKKTMS